MRDSHEENRSISEALEIIKADFADEINYHKVKVDENKLLKADNLKKDTLILKLNEVKKNVEDELEISETNAKKNNKIIKLKEKEVYDLKKENFKVKEDFDQLKLEHSKLKAQVNKEKKEKDKKIKKQEKKDFLNNLESDPRTSEIYCESCDKKFPGLENLNTHIRAIHRKQSSSQTDDKVKEDKFVQVPAEPIEKSDKVVQTLSESWSVPKEMLFEVYKCFYCGKNIASEQCLEDHRNICSGIHFKFNQYQCVRKNNNSDFSCIGFPVFSSQTLSSRTHRMPL